MVDGINGGGTRTASARLYSEQPAAQPEKKAEAPPASEDAAKVAELRAIAQANAEAADADPADVQLAADRILADRSAALNAHKLDPNFILASLG